MVVASIGRNMCGCVGVVFKFEHHLYKFNDLLHETMLFRNDQLSITCCIVHS